MKKVRIKRSRKKKQFPSPSFLPGMRGEANWHVRLVDEEETPHTLNNLGGIAEMALPVGDETIDSFIRLHELLHAAHSPVEEPRPVMRENGRFIRTDALLIAEEFRINLYGRYMVGGQDFMPDTVTRDREVTERLATAWQTSKAMSAMIEVLKWSVVIWPLTPDALSRTSQAHPILVALASRGEIDQELVTADGWLIDTIWNTIWSDEIRCLLTRGTIPTWDSVLVLGAFLSDFFDSLETPDDGKEAGDDDPDIEKIKQKHDGKAGVGRVDKAIEKVRGLERPEYVLRPNYSGDPKWALMTTRVGKLIKSLPKNLLARSKFRASDEGANPRYPHRLLTDGKVFSRKKRSPGGTVLIDDSGSMSWTTQQLVNIMEEAPAVNIAAYSGSYNEGELVIVAENGKYADMSDKSNHPTGGNNLVDLPALEWLASQPGPRIWVSDTYITLISGNERQGLEDCLDICRNYNINIVETAEEAGQVFRGELEIYR